MKLSASTKKIHDFFILLIRTIQNKKSLFIFPYFKKLDQILDQLVDENLISGYTIAEKQTQVFYKIYPKYISNHRSLVNEIEFYSRPGQKTFITTTNLGKIKEWNEQKRVAFIRTRLGFLTIKSAFKLQIGGELLLVLK